MARDEAKIAQAVAALKAHWQGGGDVNTAPSDQAPHDMRQAFAQDPQRFSRYSLRLDDLLLDWSKCRVNDTTMSLLKNLAEACGVESRRDAMFAGEAINTTEGRSVLHIALRAKPDAVIVAEGENVMPLVSDVLQRMSAFCDAIRAGTMRGATGKAITDVVNIGIGGSDLGPVMATLALTPYHDGPRTHFVSNIDPAHISDTLAGLDPQTTLIIIASKTFTTIETMTNAQTARRWISEALGEQAVGAHFVAVSTALEKVAAFGIAPERVFGFWDWVGGRYSIWSSIGLPLMLAIGKEDFRQFLDGAQAMDNHFRSATLDQNLPMMLGLIGYWHRAICDYSSRAIIPYDQHLARLPAYLQQLDMESNGKSVKVDGAPVDGPTGPVVWGEPGTNGQHAFFQLLHQGSDVIPVELMIAAKTHQPELLLQHQMLLANCFAQSEAFMKGRTLSEAQAQLRAQNLPESEVERIAPHRVFSGNRPTITLAYELLTPFALGRLIALYEHRVFVEAQLFGINAFDQWGVELGKELATQLLSVVTGETSSSDRDSSTQGLVAYLHAANGAE